MLICLDTSVLARGMKGYRSSDPGNKAEKQRIEIAKDFIESLDEHQRILLPAPVVSEYLAGLPKSHRDFAFKDLESRFIIVPFDEACSRLASDIMDKVKEAKQTARDTVSRNEVKFDAVIIAIACVQGASVIYTFDDQFKCLSDGRIRICEPSPPPRQLTFLPAPEQAEIVDIVAAKRKKKTV